MGAGIKRANYWNRGGMSMGTKALISQEETHLISLLRIAATLGVLLIHVNQRLPLPGLLGSIAGYGADGVKCFFFLTANCNNKLDTPW